jgi:hypothetical protein
MNLVLSLLILRPICLAAFSDFTKGFYNGFFRPSDDIYAI